jgi:hypothetical protein
MFNTVVKLMIKPTGMILNTTERPSFLAGGEIRMKDTILEKNLGIIRKYKQPSSCFDLSSFSGRYVIALPSLTDRL